MRLAILALMILALAGCATSGKKITQAQLNQVVDGQTTRSDLIALLGPPTSEARNSDGTEVLGWGYAHVGFAGIGTEVQGVSMIIGPDGTVRGYSRTGSAPITDSLPLKPAPASTPPVAGQPLSKAAYQEQQLQQLMQENLPYEEYQKRHRAIMTQ